MHEEKLIHETSSNNKIVTSHERPFVTKLTFTTDRISNHTHIKQQMFRYFLK